jgi:uncharacterized membrane protein YkvA (DUF1232 family)
VEDVMNVYFDAPDGAIDMSLLATLLFFGAMALSLWARFDLIPDHVAEIGFADDALILQRVIRRNQSELIAG